MPKQVIWSPLAEQDLDALLNYLHTAWNDSVVNQFLDELEHLIKHISANPHLFPLVHVKKKVRKCVISKHNSLFYRETKQEIQILRLFDTRQHPKNLKIRD